MVSKYTIIVDPLSTGQEYPAAFKEAGQMPVAVLSGSEPPPAYTTSWHPDDFEHVHYFTGDVSALADELRSYEPEYLVPGAESGVELCDQLTEILVPGTGNVPALASARRDKWQMAQALSAAGVPRLRQFLTSDPAEAEKWLKENDLLGKRLVIKPPKSAAGDEVYVVFEDGDWRERFDRVLGRTNKMGLTNEAVLIQEYAEGTEYLVDSYSVDGVHSLVDVCRYTKVEPRRQDRHLPPDRLPRGRRSRSTGCLALYATGSGRRRHPDRLRALRDHARRPTGRG